MYKIPKTKFKGINITVKNYATINFEKHRLNILTWKCSDPEGLWASDFLRFCSICTHTMMRCTRYTQSLKEWVNVTGTWAVITPITWSRVGMLHLCPRGGVHAPWHWWGGRLWPSAVVLGLNSVIGLAQPVLLPNEPSHRLKFWHTWYFSATLNLCHFSPISTPVLK